jgi:hypothetical protein
MNQYEAQQNFQDELNRTYGEGNYRGGGNDIREWVNSVCVQKAVPALAPTKTKSVKVTPKPGGKLVNGFLVTNETPDLIHRQLKAANRNIPEPYIIEEYALTQGEAKKKADIMAKKYNSAVFVIPTRLWEDDRKRLSVPQRVLEVTPGGGQEAIAGKWKFEVEVSV